MRVMGHLCYKQWLSQLALFSLDKTRLQGDLISMPQNLKRAYKSNVYKSMRAYKSNLFNRACSNRTGGNSFTWKKCRFRLDGRRKLFMRKVVELWHSLPEKLVDAQAWPLVLGRALSNLVWWKMALHVARFLDQMSFEDAFVHRHFVILYMSDLRWWSGIIHTVGSCCGLLFTRMGCPVILPC